MKAKKLLSLLVLITFISSQLYTPYAHAHDYTIYGGTAPEQPQNPSKSKIPPRNEETNPENLDPVLVHSGEFIYTHQDLLIPSRGLPIEITRTYKSQTSINTRFGYGWFFSFYIQLKKLTDNNVLILNTDARKDEFSYNSNDNSYTSPPGIYSTLTQNQNGTYTLTQKNGTKYNFDINGNLSTIIDRNNNQLTFTYDSQGKLPIIGRSKYFITRTEGIIAYDYKLTKITDSLGREINFTYNDNGRLTTITDFTGRTYSYTYDQNNNLTSFTTPATTQYPQGLTTTYTYDDQHNLLFITDPKEQTYITNHYDDQDRVDWQTYGSGTPYISYDETNNQTTVTDKKGFKTIWTFNQNGNPIKKEELTALPKLRETDPDSYITTYEYNTDMERTKITYPKGNWTKYTYDNKGNLLEIRRKNKYAEDLNDPDNDIVTTFTYEPNYNFIKTITDPKGSTTTYYYDYEEATLGDLNADGITTNTNGNLVKVEYPLVNAQSPLTTFTYNPHGQVETVTDPQGTITKYEYAPLTGYLTKTTADYGANPENLNHTTQLTYDSVGNVTSITDPKANTTTFQYNSLNQLIKTISPQPFNYQTRYTYDENGNLKKTERQQDDTATEWQTTKYEYNTMDKLTKIIQYLTDAETLTTEFQYDKNDNRTQITDPKGNTTTYQYDERDLLFKVTDALANITEYAYDQNGNLKEIKDAKENTTTYEYDDFDRLTKTIYPDSTTELYTYDTNSNLTSKTTRKTDTITYTYDTLNRLELKTYPDTSTVDYSYDIVSRLTEVHGPQSIVHSYQYDNLNRVISVDNDGVGTGLTPVRYEYDSNGNRTKLEYPDGSYISYAYDELNRLTRIDDDQSTAIASYAYGVLSRRTQLDYANNTQATYQYDNINRLTNLVNQTTVPTTISSFNYTYDKVGNRTQMVKNGTDIHTYTYDSIYQLTNVTYPDTTTQTYNFDAAGNRTSLTEDETTTTYTTNNLNQYTTVNSTAHSYDQNGNLTNDETLIYTYDYENRLTTATKTGMSATYTYDPFGRRIQKNVDGTITNFIYDGDQVILETDATDTIQVKYIYGPGIDEPISMERGGQTYYYHFDGLGSVTSITNSTGTVVESYEYDVYGRVTFYNGNGQEINQSNIENPYLFTSRRMDEESGLYYFRARYYPSILGKFLQTDPYTWGPDDIRTLFRQDLYAQIERDIIFVIGSLNSKNYNRYLYVGNDPINFIDPWGFDKKSFIPPPMAVAVTIGGTATFAFPGFADDAVFWTAVGVVVSSIAVYHAGKAVINYFRNGRSYRRPHSPTNPKNRRPKPGQPKKPKPDRSPTPAPSQHNRPPDPDDILNRGRFPHDPGAESAIPPG